MRVWMSPEEGHLGEEARTPASPSAESLVVCGLHGIVRLTWPGYRVPHDQREEREYPREVAAYVFGTFHPLKFAS